MVEAGIPNALLKRRKAQRRRALARVMADPTLSRRHRDRLAASKSAVWDEATMMPYDTFDDYTEMMIQFGYVTFFSLAWPLAPLFALINNVVEIRTDAFRLCYLSQRPVAHRAGGIGVWFNVLQSMSVLAIMTNCAHIGFTSRHITTYFPGITEGQKVFAVFMFEVRALLTGPAVPRPHPCPPLAARRPSAGLGDHPRRPARVHQAAGDHAAPGGPAPTLRLRLAPRRLPAQAAGRRQAAGYRSGRQGPRDPLKGLVECLIFLERRAPTAPGPRRWGWHDTAPPPPPPAPPRPATAR